MIFSFPIYDSFADGSFDDEIGKWFPLTFSAATEESRIVDVSYYPDGVEISVYVSDDGPIATLLQRKERGVS